jgi:hypothetical protein
VNLKAFAPPRPHTDNKCYTNIRYYGTLIHNTRSFYRKLFPNTINVQKIISAMAYRENLLLRKKKAVPLSEEESMKRFYEPIDHKQRVLNKWLKAPER